MKICQGCTSPIVDEAMFCPICGRKQEIEKRVTNMFCVKCGNAINPNMHCCARCGAPNMIAYTQAIFQKNIPIIIRQLSTRIIIVSIIWICIASFQLLCAMIMGLCFLLERQPDYFLYMIIYGALGGVNLWGAVKDLIYQNRIKKNFVGILYDMRVTGGVICTYLYNAFVIWDTITAEGWIAMLMGMLTLAALITDIIAIRLFLKVKRDSFIQLERSQTIS